MAKSSRIIDNLTNNTLYSFHVRAKNTMGVWSDLNVAVNKTTTKDTTAPAVLSSITLLLLFGVFHLKWAKPSTLDLRGGGYKMKGKVGGGGIKSFLLILGFERDPGYGQDLRRVLDKHHLDN